MSTSGTEFNGFEVIDDVEGHLAGPIQDVADEDDVEGHVQPASVEDHDRLRSIVVQ